MKIKRDESPEAGQTGSQERRGAVTKREERGGTVPVSFGTTSERIRKTPVRTWNPTSGRRLPHLREATAQGAAKHRSVHQDH